MFFPFHGVSPIFQTIMFGGGMIVLALVIGIVESGMARLRLNRIPQLLISAFVLALVGLLIVLVKGV